MIQRVAIVSILVALVGVAAAALPAGAASIFWANAVSGDWSDPLNWNPQQVPGAADFAFINLAGTYTVTMDVDADILRFSVGASTGTQTLVMNGRVMTISSTTAATVVLGGVLDLTGGSLITGSSSLNNLAEIHLENSQIDVEFSNGGDLIAGGTSGIAGAFTTNSSSTITLQDGGSLTVSDGFTNNNVIYMSGDGSTLSVTSGILTNASGCVITSTGAGAARTIGAELENEGTVSVSADLTLLRDDADHVNDGNINCFGGDMTVSQSGASPSLTNNGSITVGSGYDFTVTAGAFNNTGTGTIGGEGTLVVTGATLSNSGNLSPGTSPGILTITGDYAQTASGTTTIEIGGLTPGTEYDRVAISGTATLDGTLDVSLIFGYFPSDGDDFTVMTYGAHTGAFADTSSLDLGGGMRLIQEYTGTELILHAYQEPDVVLPIDPETCLTPGNNCLNVPFYFQRLNTDMVRGYNVTFTLSPELELCDGLNSIVEGPFLKNFCGGSCTQFFKHDDGGGQYTVNAIISGANCGPDSSGTLFTIDVTDAGVDGNGIITCSAVTMRDCSNQPVAGGPGGSISIGIDVADPPSITDLAVTQQKTGNDDDGTTLLTLTYTGDTSGHLVEIFRKGYGDYPEYDDGTGALPTIPTDPDDAQANGWTKITATGSGETDDPPTRDYYYYCMFLTSDCDLQSVSNMTDGVLNYHLGDVSDGFVQCDGDNEVGVPDMSFLGNHYWATGSPELPDSIACLDVGPTDDFSVDGLPETDNVISFEDLILFGINYNVVDQPRVNVPITVNPLSQENPVLALSVDPVSPAMSSMLTARLSLGGNLSTVKGISSVISYDPTQMELVHVSTGDLIQRQEGANIFFKHLDGEEGIKIDTAIFGQDLTFSGSGDVAVLSFRVHGTAVQPTLAMADLRDLSNRALLDLEGGSDDRIDNEPISQSTTLPDATQLIGARPNPFTGNTSIAFQLSSEAAVNVSIYDVGGRLVRTLVNKAMAAGEHSITWDGKSDRGQSLSTGIYMYTFRAGSVEKTQKLFLFR